MTTTRQINKLINTTKLDRARKLLARPFTDTRVRNAELHIANTKRYLDEASEAEADELTARLTVRHTKLTAAWDRFQDAVADLEEREAAYVDAAARVQVHSDHHAKGSDRPDLALTLRDELEVAEARLRFEAPRLVAAQDRAHRELRKCEPRPDRARDQAETAARWLLDAFANRGQTVTPNVSAFASLDEDALAWAALFEARAIDEAHADERDELAAFFGLARRAAEAAE